jgi:hypothetical protein
MHPTYQAQLDDLPPKLCFLQARSNGRAMTQEDIQRLTGWGKAKVARAVNSWTFADFTVADADTFRIACGVSRVQERRVRQYLRNTLDLSKTINSFNHLRKNKSRLTKLTKALGGRNF